MDGRNDISESGMNYTDVCLLVGASQNGRR